MKRLLMVCAITGFLVSCGKKTTDSSESESNTTVVEQKQEEQVVDDQKGQEFDIESLAVSQADIGDFPYFNLPSGLRQLNKPLQRNFDVCFFPVAGVMTPFEGKLYKIAITAERGEEFSQRYFEKSMEDYMESVGGVKVFDGAITREEYDRYNKQDPNKGGEGDIGYAGQPIRFYVIRSAAQGNIYVQYTANNAGASLNVLQEAGFQQTMTKVKAEDIAKDLTTKGKSVLYINFDVDKATINQEALTVVSEITKALNAETALNISIEGHTDNTGDSQHNKQLSTKRADAVKEALIKQGITASRLSSTGYGADKPLVDNNSEENKAKNRRVELLRVK